MFSSVRGTRASPGAPPPEGPPQAARAKAPKASAWKRPRERANRLGRNETRAGIQVVCGTMTYRATPSARKKRTRRRSAKRSPSRSASKHWHSSARSPRERAGAFRCSRTRRWRTLSRSDSGAVPGRTSWLPAGRVARSTTSCTRSWPGAGREVMCARGTARSAALHAAHVATPRAGTAGNTESTTETCSSRRTRYCDMYPAGRLRSSDM